MDFAKRLEQQAGGTLGMAVERIGKYKTDG
jgi:hypothetical protein